LIAGAAAFEGFKLFEDKQRNEGMCDLLLWAPGECIDSLLGKPVSHAFAKELLAGFVGGEVDKLAETKGKDAWDRHEAHKHAKQSAEQMYNEHYIDDQGANQYSPNEYERPPRFKNY
jgi:Protein of unknown function (DUF3759)